MCSHVSICKSQGFAPLCLSVSSLTHRRDRFSRSRTSWRNAVRSFTDLFATNRDNEERIERENFLSSHFMWHLKAWCCCC